MDENKEGNMDYIMVFVTAPDEKTAAGIARTIVEERLAACANIVKDIRSIYRWQGKVEDEPEVLMIAKTRKGLFEALENRVRDMHPYEVPEIISAEVTQGSKPYLEWLSDAVEDSL